MGKTGLSVASGVLRVVQVACAIALIVIIPWRLLDVDVNLTTPAGETVQVASECLLDGPSRGSSNQLCIYGIAVGAVALIAAAIITVLRCLTCSFCGISKAVYAIFNVLLVVWWTVAAVQIFRAALEANDFGLPEKEARSWVLAAIVTAIVSYAADLFVSILGIFT